MSLLDYLYTYVLPMDTTFIVKARRPKDVASFEDRYIRGSNRIDGTPYTKLHFFTHKQYEKLIAQAKETGYMPY